MPPKTLSQHELATQCFSVTLHYVPAPGLHTHPYHEFIISVDGAGTQHTPAGVQPMAPGELFFFPAGHRHIGNSRRGTPCRCLVLYLAEQTFSPALEGDRDAALILQALSTCTTEGENRLPLSPDGGAHSLAVLTELEGELRVKAPGYRSAVQMRLHDFVLTLLRDPGMPPAVRRACAPASQRERLADVYRFLHSHYMQRIRVAQLLDLAHLSRSQFHAVFKADTGQTLTEYVTTLRLSAAATLLRATATPIAEVAYQCGFSSLSHFYAAFRTAYATSPHALRRQEMGG
jgi:AraC-like DNA-binding protein